MSDESNIREATKTTLLKAAMESYENTGVMCVKYKGEIWYGNVYPTSTLLDWRSGIGSFAEQTIAMHFNYNYHKMLNAKEFEIVNKIS